VVDLGAAFARAVDFLVNVLERSHGSKNVRCGLRIPASTAEEKHDQNGAADHRGDDRNHVQERRHA
jgi:hypothetical protein